MTATAMISITGVRDAAGAALAPEDDTDPMVIVDPVDSVTPPALMLLQGEPWIEPGVPGAPTMGPCLLLARLRVLCLAPRIEPAPGYRTLESLVAYTIGRMRADPYIWTLISASEARAYRIGAIDCLGAEVIYTTPAST